MLSITDIEAREEFFNAMIFLERTYWEIMDEESKAKKKAAEAQAKKDEFGGNRTKVPTRVIGNG